MGIRYSQNNEQDVIESYFGDNKGTLLSIGENDGYNLSNALNLINKGWNAVLVEPAWKAYIELTNRHKDNPNVQCINIAISDYCGTSILYDSDSHLNNGDTSLLSTLNKKETEKWVNNKFNEQIVGVINYKLLLQKAKYKKFDFITIDAEGSDVVILKQIDLTNVKCLCIEHNGSKDAINSIKEYCSKYGLTEQILFNAENIILTKNCL